MTARIAAVLWLVVGIAVWNGFYDLYVSRGARLYLQLQAESELGRVPPPVMAEVMAESTHAGLVAASLWAGLVTASGWVTIAFVRSRRSP